MQPRVRPGRPYPGLESNPFRIKNFGLPDFDQDLARFSETGLGNFLISDEMAGRSEAPIF